MLAPAGELHRALLPPVALLTDPVPKQAQMLWVPRQARSELLLWLQLFPVEPSLEMWQVPMQAQMPWVLEQAQAC